ncbi:MAG TPA: acetate/propionate family kinase [Actinomycetes bacterium]|jgi:acetate kinase|nr:acetate/propionate family kinase [Actinomycetes bacterium]
MRVLVVNAGSSSLKLGVLDASDRVLARANLSLPRADDLPGRLARFLSGAPRPDAAGHRVVHGGPRFRSSTVITGTVVGQLRGLGELAPLHNPPALAAVEALARLRPELPAVACFDTAFHATLPDAAATYAVPWSWTEQYGIRRFGFHGLSHAYAARRAAQLLGRPLRELRAVTCHLGAGASLAAVAGGMSVDTTMGFTPLEGLVMATRSGSLDPGALLLVQRRAGLSPEQAERVLDQDSGLLGVSGVSGDMRVVLDAADQGHGRARLAVAVYGHRLRAGIAAMAAAMGGLDALVFTGGVGEHQPPIRQAACEALAFLGVGLDPAANLAAGDEDADLSASGARVRVLLVEAREDLEIARETRRLLVPG